MELTIQQALQQAVEAHKAGKLQDAEALYRAILRTQPNHPDANHNLGVLAVSLHNSELALPLFKTALEANSKQMQFWISYVDALIKANQLEVAKSVLEQGKKLGLTGERVDALEVKLTSVGSVARSESIVQKQLSSFTQKRNKASVIKKNFLSNQTNTNLGRIPSQLEVNSLLDKFKKGQYDLAENLAKKLTQKYPEHQFSWKVLGAVFKQTGRLQEALIANQRAVAIAPNDAEAHSSLGIALKELGRLEDAEASYRKAIAIKPHYADAQYNLGNTLKELGRLKDAEASFRKAIAIKPDLALAYGNLGNTLKELGRLEDAEASYRKAIAIMPVYADVHHNLGIVLNELGRLEDAEASYRKAIAINPDLAPAYSNLGRMLKELGRLEDAEASYRKAIAIKRDLEEVNDNLGVTLQKFGKFGKLEDALTSHSKAIQIKLDYAEVFYNLSITLLFLDKLDEASQVLQELKLIDPDSYGLKACVNLAILNYLNNDLSSSKLFISDSTLILKKEKSNFKNEIAYWIYLSALLDSQELEIQDSIDDLKIQKLYVIGDSHSLASHGLYVKTTQSHYLCQSRWIVGCKQWHLGCNLENEYKYKFNKIIQSIAFSSNILLSIGEIDCRLDDGILNHIKKYPTKSRNEMIVSTINNYLIYISKALTPLNHTITIQGVPCPNINISKKDENDVSTLIEFIDEFNDVLEQRSHFFGFNFLDLHKMTNRGDGFSNGKWHIDRNHLSPAGMQEAWLNWFRPYSA